MKTKKPLTPGALIFTFFIIIFGWTTFLLVNYGYLKLVLKLINID